MWKNTNVTPLDIRQVPVNEDNWLLHTKEFTLLPDLFLKMKVADPEGLYILNFLSVSYPIPGVATDNLKEEQMFDFSMIIPSACKHFYQHGMEIAVVDGAHLYTKYEGVILTICTKDGEDHIVKIGFAVVPRGNKYYWQEFINAVFHLIRRHRMIMSD